MPLKLRGCESLEQGGQAAGEGATFLSTGSCRNLSNYIMGYGLYEDGGSFLECSGQVSGITVLDLKHGPATQGTQQMRDGGSPQPSPLTLPTSPFIHTTRFI